MDTSALQSILIVIGFVFVVTAGVAFISLAPWLPTRAHDIERGLALSDLKAGERFYDLGCGDGRVVIAAMKRGALAIGIELSLAMHFVCLIRQRFGAKDAQFRFGNAFHTDLSDADVVYVFGTPDPMKKRLMPKLRSELKPGARVVSYTFEFEGWEPAAVSRPDPTRDFPIYLYIR